MNHFIWLFLQQEQLQQCHYWDSKTIMLIWDRKMYITPFFNINGYMATNKLYLSQTLFRVLPSFQGSSLNMVVHHLTDEVWTPASLFSPCLFSFLLKPNWKVRIRQPPGVWLGCSPTSQPLSGNDGVLKATAFIRTGSDGPFAKVMMIHVRGGQTGM